ncbi:UNVERIFIED_CONTAM: hypothetical protein K2H54_040786 [Gekko kuhli]
MPQGEQTRNLAIGANPSPLVWWRMATRCGQDPGLVTLVLLAAVFAQGNPFLEASGFRSHYHPSRAELLSRREQSTVLSPPRLQQRNRPASPKEAEPSSLPLLSFLPDSSCQGATHLDSDSASPYNESWPSTERSSSSLTPDGAKALLPEQTPGTKALTSPELQGSKNSFSDSESVIARYIERFRYGQPANRRERWTPGSKSPPFWWLGHSSPSDGDNSKTETSTSSSGSRKNVDAANAFIGTGISLQTWAGMEEGRLLSVPSWTILLQRNPKTLPRWIPTLSACKREQPGSCTEAAFSALSCPIAQMSPPHSSSRPEDDILFQWRLRRKMEEASKVAAVLPSVGWRSQCTEPAYLPSMVGGAALTSPEPTSWRTKDRTAVPPSEAQPRSTLDEHPCCCRGHWRSGPSSQPPTEGASFSDRNVMLGRFEPNRERGVKEPIPREDPVPVCPDFLPLPKPVGATKPLDPSPSGHSQKTAWPVQKVCSEPRGKQRPSRSEQGRPKAPRDSAKSPASPGKHVQRVLGEVVSERLFSSPEPPAPQRGRLKRSSKKQGLKESPPDAVVTPSYPELLNMAAQLLEQAEDSDGTEFEEDPLLQVLRSQRGLLCSQLRAVDARVAQLEGHHPNQDLSHP